VKVKNANAKKLYKIWRYKLAPIFGLYVMSFSNSFDNSDIACHFIRIP